MPYSYIKKQNAKLIIFQPLGDSPEAAIAWMHIINFNQRTGIVSASDIYAPRLDEQQEEPGEGEPSNSRRFARYIDVGYLQQVLLGRTRLRYINQIKTVQEIGVHELATMLADEIFNADVQENFDLYVLYAAHRWKLLLSFYSEFLSTGFTYEDDFHPWDVGSYIQQDIPKMETLADVYAVVNLIAQNSMPADGKAVGMLPNPNVAMIAMAALAPHSYEDEGRN